MDQRGKILIVDDDENIRQVLLRTLKAGGYVCETASDGRQGLEALSQGQFAVALIDLKMPQLDGMALLSELAATTIDTVSIILTGHGDLSSAVEAMKFGAYDFIEKPCGDEMIHSVVKRASEHHQMMLQARALGAMVERWETVFDAWPDVIVVLGLDRRIILCNHTLAEQLGLRKEEIIGRPCHEALCFDAHPPEDCPFTKPSVEDASRLTEFQHRQWGIHYELTSASLRDRLGRPWGWLHIARDISERKRAEEKLLAYHDQLHALGSQLALTEARERHRIAVEMHDGIGQTLALVKLRLNLLCESLAASARVADEVLAIRDLIDQTIHSTRALTFELSPPVLYEVGLEAAVAVLLERIQSDHGIVAHLENDGQPLPLDRNLRVFLFQAVRELLINVVKHARASQIKVTLQKQEDHIRVTVEDNGIGFDAARLHGELGQHGGFGLFNIRERFDHLNGEFRIESTTGLGTKITIAAPIES